MSLPSARSGNPASTTAPPSTTTAIPKIASATSVSPQAASPTSASAVAAGITAENAAAGADTVPALGRTDKLPAPVSRHDWTTAEIEALLRLPLLELLWQAQAVHRAANPGYRVQLASLLSVRTGGCEEDCSYCSQSIYNSSDLANRPAMEVESVLRRARAARDAGAQRFCMGWAWREIRDGEAFEAMLEMVRGVRELGLEACVTAGMLSDHQAQRLAEAGLSSYNHNLDTSPEYYDRIVSTRTYEERLETLRRVRQAGINLCCGGIIGLGENLRDRASLLRVLASLDPHPESVPINALVAVEGTPLQEQPPVDPLEVVRMVATARILMPSSRVRLSAGREGLSREAQILCLLAGADSMFYGDTLLTTGNPQVETDRELLAAAGVSAWRQEDSGGGDMAPPCRT